MTEDVWKSAPAWANYTATDSNGARWFYEHEPTLAKDLGIFTAGGSRVQAAEVEGWETSLRRRGDRGRVLLTFESMRLGFTLEALHAAGWTDEQLVEHGHARWAP